MRYLNRFVYSNAEFPEELAGELVTVGQLYHSPVDAHVDADVEVVGAVEQMIVRWRFRNAMTTCQCTCIIRMQVTLRVITLHAHR